VTARRALPALVAAAAALLGMFAVAGGHASAGHPGTPGTVTVERVVDGDTVVVHTGSRQEKVRLVGIDTPETVDPRKAVQCFGKEASDRTKALLPKGTVVRLERDVEARDVYGRLLAYVYRASDGMFVNLDLAEEGYARPLTIPPNVAYAERFAAAATEAARNGRGLWRACR
jgi:micrococcal nuclease